MRVLMTRKTISICKYLLIVLCTACFFANSLYAQSVYYLPQIANGGNGGRFTTTFVLCNNSGSAFAATLELFDDEGNPLIMAVDGNSGSRFTIHLPAGGTQLLETDGQGSLVAGVAKISSPAEIGVSEIFRVYDMDGTHYTETGISDAKPLSSFVLPVDTTASFNTALAVLNTTGRDATVTLTLRDSSGQQSGIPVIFTLGANKHIAHYVYGPGQLFPTVANFQGSILVQSSEPLASIALRENASPLSYTSVSSVSTSSTEQKLYLPQIANGSFGSGIYKTSFLITNISAAPANVTLSLTGDDGKPVSMTIIGQGRRNIFTFSNLASGASLFLQTDGVGGLNTAAAMITSDIPVSVSGIFTVLNSTGAFQTEAAVNGSTALNSFAVPVVVTGDYDTGIALTGTTSSDDSLKIQLLDTEGNAVGMGFTMSLSAGGHMAKMVSELFPGIHDFKGSLWVSSSTEVAALALRISGSPLALTTLPVVTYGKGSFSGSILLGAPTSNSIKLNIYSAGQSGKISVQYGTSPGKLDNQTSSATLSAGIPMQIALTGLYENTVYYYRLFYEASAGSSSGPTDWYTFRTARPAGTSFTFTIQADSHLDENSDLNLYRKTLSNVQADAPDFHIDLGDTFMCEKYSAPLTSTVQTARDPATVNARYEYERGNFGIISPSVPLFLVNGNHEGETGWFVDGTANNLAVWTTEARQQFYLNPTPDPFYGGDTTSEAFVGERASWYSWQWGDALFVVLDPYWNTRAKGGTDGWNLTLGPKQYQWLRDTLAASSATYKFIFIHSLVGGLDGQYRGGIEAAPYFEWGGKNPDGTDGFSKNRPGWGVPIHQMLKQYGVTAVFHGHDHLYARQTLDGIVYLEVPQPSAKNTSSGAALATQYHYSSGTILSSSGHLRVTVSPNSAQAQYVRAWLPASETATQKNGEIDDSWSVTLQSTVPVASFSLSPAAALAGQSIQFTDSSSGGPVSWAWNFGDGVSSSTRNPVHTYASAGSYSVTLSVTNSAGSNSTSRLIAVGAADRTSLFDGSIVLGSPAANSVKANVLTSDQSGTAFIAYGKSSGTYEQTTSIANIQPSIPVEFTLTGLLENTRYYYRLYFKPAGTGNFGNSTEMSFHTARSAGETFTFAIQGDSHPEREKSQFDAELYRRTLATAAADHPDFYILMGDDFSVDNLDPTTVNPSLVNERYTLQRPYLGLIGNTAPLFLVNGNHEQAARYLLDGTPDNVAVWAQNARNSLYSQPAPDSFYSGNAEVVPYIGLLRNYYAWQWGDALFVVLDPYWSSPVCVDAPFGGGSKRSNMWDITHGDAEYQWLKTTLEQSTAKYKFVFAHHVMGTQRGGVEIAGLYEWGGGNANGTWGFSKNRPTWSLPLHQLMVANHVTIFFQGHDHIWVRQQLDGVTYQTLSEPADPNYSWFNADAYLSGDKFPNSGYTRVTVSTIGVKVDYVRTYPAKDEAPGRENGAVAFSYTIP